MTKGHGGRGQRRVHPVEQEHEQEHENHERWLVSYADFMTLLMVLFIVLFAISQVDAKKFLALKTGLTVGFGAPVDFLNGAEALLQSGTRLGQDQENLAGVAGNRIPDPEAQASAGGSRPESVNPQQVADLVNALADAHVKEEVQKLKQAEAALRKALQVAGVAGGATFRFDERGLVMSIATDKVLFESGKARLLPVGHTILDAVAPTLLALPNRLSIDGHTDSDPISTAQFPSNWELASARADGVLRYLASVHRIPDDRMVASSFADTRPATPGHSAKAMAADRRVEIVVLARLDNSDGRAVAELGNSATAGGTSSVAPPSTTASAVPTTSAGDPTAVADRLAR
ncbi:MAG TPA: flagellar motor protein MotB [Kineosporiaceae bacterium]